MAFITKKSWLIAAIAISILFTTEQASAQAPYQYAVGSRNTCNASGTSLTTIGNYTADIPYTGYGTFQTVANSEQPASTSLMAVEFSGVGFDPQLGEVAWRLDNRLSPIGSEIRAYSPTNPFPANALLSFHAIVTVSSQPGTIYTSETPIIMENRELTDWPTNNTIFTQQGTVTFRAINDPNQTMQVNTMTAALTARDQNESYLLPVGTQSTCQASGSSLTNYNGYVADIPFDGAGTFVTTRNSQTPVASTELSPMSISGSGLDPQLGEVYWEADIDRTRAAGLMSTITAHQERSQLPATGRLIFYARIKLRSLNDAVYLSESPVIMVNGNITEWPHNNAEYAQEGRVIFRNTQDLSQTMAVDDMRIRLTASAR